MKRKSEGEKLCKKINNKLFVCVSRGLKKVKDK